MLSEFQYFPTDMLKKTRSSIAEVWVRIEVIDKQLEMFTR